jgi:Immunity protein 26
MTISKRANEGALVRIDLANGTDVFARVLPNAQAAFYSAKCVHAEPTDISRIYNSEILFVTTVMKYAFENNRWPVVDERPLEKALLTPRNYFMKDVLTGQFSIYRSSDGAIHESSKEECQGLEEAAVWDPQHIEERLRDHFVGRPNRYVEQMTAKLN